MIVGICKIDLAISGPNSLKEKRQILRRVKDSILSSFKVPVSEVGENDLWQRTSLGFAVVGNDRANLNALIDKISDKIVALSNPRAVDRKFEFIDYNE